jgi:hypothetical protein
MAPYVIRTNSSGDITTSEALSSAGLSRRRIIKTLATIPARLGRARNSRSRAQRDRRSRVHDRGHRNSDREPISPRSGRHQLASRLSASYCYQCA